MRAIRALRCASVSLEGWPGGGDCDAMLTARSCFFQRVPDKDAPFLDPDRQQLMRAQIESEFP
jgi:hypothetical protein